MKEVPSLDVMMGWFRPPSCALVAAASSVAAFQRGRDAALQ